MSMQLCIVSGAITNKSYVGILFAACLRVIIVVVEELEAMRDGKKKMNIFSCHLSVQAEIIEVNIHRRVDLPFHHQDVVRSHAAHATWNK